MKYDKRIDEAIRDIRGALGSLPAGERLYIENKLNRISSQVKKGIRRGAYVPAEEPETATGYAPTSQQIADRYEAKKAVFEAMLAGRKINFRDSQEFKVSEMHTTICNIRKDIATKNLPYILCDEVFHFGPKNKVAKNYWLIRKEEDGLC